MSMGIHEALACHNNNNGKHVSEHEFWLINIMKNPRKCLYLRSLLGLILLSLVITNLKSLELPFPGEIYTNSDEICFETSK